MGVALVRRAQGRPIQPEQVAAIVLAALARNPEIIDAPTVLGRLGALRRSASRRGSCAGSAPTRSAATGAWARVGRDAGCRPGPTRTAENTPVEPDLARTSEGTSAPWVRPLPSPTVPLTPACAAALDGPARPAAARAVADQHRRGPVDGATCCWPSALPPPWSTTRTRPPPSPRIAGGVLVNLGTPYDDTVVAMERAVARPPTTAPLGARPGGRRRPPVAHHAGPGPARARPAGRHPRQRLGGPGADRRGRRQGRRLRAHPGVRGGRRPRPGGRAPHRRRGQRTRRPPHRRRTRSCGSTTATRGSPG